MQRQKPWPLGVFLLLVLVAFAAWRYLRQPDAEPNHDSNATGSIESRTAGRYLFCFWNVENLFDDQEDPQREGVDRELDRWYSANPAILKQKLNNLGDALLRLNGGIGPDILAMVEVEGLRAAELLRQALNDRIADSTLQYRQVVVKDTQGLRHISPAVITRLPVDTSRTRVLGRGQRILQSHVVVDGKELVLITSHWTSRVTDKDGAARRRYADQVYGAYRAIQSRNPNVDCLICGDFNDTPTDVSVSQHLHATGNRAAVLNEKGPPLLFNLLADRDADQFGTHYFQRLMIFDQIVVSPGMLDNNAWSCEPSSTHVVNTLHRPNDRRKRPWAFGREDHRSPRGSSDHFPVTVELQAHRRKR